MKKILIVATGGTIGSSLIGGCRRLNTGVATSTLLNNFLKSGSHLAQRGIELFVDSGFEHKTLSENMTPEVLFEILKHISSFDMSSASKYSGIIVLHGTDTLAFTAAFLSATLCGTQIPVVLVSGNRPPDMEKSNANANFRAAAELIAEGLAPNVYAVYKNSGERTYLHLGQTLMQCENFSDDFRSSSAENAFLLEDNKLQKADAERLAELSEKRAKMWGREQASIESPNKNVLLIKPYTGLDYSRISLEGVDGVVHSSYHSGTVCAVGEDSPYSIIAFGKSCKEYGIPLYVAPCVLGKEQYESAYEAQKGGMIPLNMTTELAYAKLLVALSMGLLGDKLNEYMQNEI